MNIKNKKKIHFNLNDFFPFIEGLDISINFSMVLFLSSYFFESLDNRISIIVMCAILSLSLISRVLDLKISQLLKKSKLININFFLILFVLYLIPTLIYNDFPLYLSIGIFIFFRIVFGILMSLAYRNVEINNEKFSTNILEVKYWILLSIGLALGNFFYLLVNEVYSNNSLNEGGWKILYIIISTFFLSMYFFSRLISKSDIKLNFEFDISQNFHPLKFFLDGFIIFVPFISFLLFASSNWLPKFCNPENLYFLSYGFIYLFLTVLFFIFITPLANLVGKRKSIIFFNLSIFIVSSIISFINHSSSYSIDFLKFFLSIVSSFSICCFVLQLKVRKIDCFSSISVLNLTMFLIGLITPLIFYISIQFSLNYSVIYIFLSIVYFINYITFLIKKDG